MRRCRARTIWARAARIENFDSYDCRGRNRVAGAKISEHGKANALDIARCGWPTASSSNLTDPHVPHGFREKVRTSVCARFTTVLGPGSDGYHENHIHVDLAQRRSGYRLCQWNVLDPTPAAAVVTTFPLPLPRPKIEDATLHPASVKASTIAPLSLDQRICDDREKFVQA